MGRIAIGQRIGALKALQACHGIGYIAFRVCTAPRPFQTLAQAFCRHSSLHRGPVSASLMSKPCQGRLVRGAWQGARLAAESLTSTHHCILPAPTEE